MMEIAKSNSLPLTVFRTRFTFKWPFFENNLQKKNYEAVKFCVVIAHLSSSALALLPTDI